MKQSVQAILLLVVSTQALSAQDVGPAVPPSTPPRPAPELASPPPTLESEPAIVPELKGVVICESITNVVPSGITDFAGLRVEGPEFLRLSQDELLAEVINRYLERPLGNTQLRAMQTNIVKFCRDKDHWVVDVFYPYEQDVTSGVLQIVVMEGRVGRLDVQNEGRKWFSDKLIHRNIRVKEGDVILGSRLVGDLNWLGRNDFFRSVDATFNQGATLGAVDLELRVRDRFPLRAFAGYDDAGNDILGNNRLLAGFNWGNVFGWDHQLNYQFTSDIEFNHLNSHAASYVAPLPWRHALTLFGYYADIDGNLEEIGFAGLSQEGSSAQASARYGIPLPMLSRYFHELILAFDYKQSDNNLLFGGADFYATPTEIVQFGGGYRGILYDRLGETSFDLLGIYSPGGVTSKNTDDYFNETRPGATANYYYLQLQADRITRLPFLPDWQRRDLQDSFTWVVRGSFQYTDDRLLPSEAWALGGYATVRGYDERVVNGDYGWLVSTEIRSPEFRISNLLKRHDEKQPAGGLGDRLQLLAFLDYGSRKINSPSGSGEEDIDLLSVGAGLRWRISTVFSLRFDYGVQLQDLPSSLGYATQDSRMHIGLSASY